MGAVVNPGVGECVADGEARVETGAVVDPAIGE
jgi:hypothetical protein